MVNVLREADKPTSQAQRGILVLFVGPSGSGKDTLINWLKEQYCDNNRIIFAQRTVTRPVAPQSEDHFSLDKTAFRDAQKRGDFAVTWAAHGHYYGLPISALHHVKNGGMVVANGARRALNDIEAVFGNVLIINLTVKPNVLRERLRSRGRETDQVIEERLKAAAMPFETSLPITEIDNSRAVDDAGNQIISRLNNLLNQVVEGQLIL